MAIQLCTLPQRTCWAPSYPVLVLYGIYSAFFPPSKRSPSSRGVQPPLRCNAQEREEGRGEQQPAREQVSIALVRRARAIRSLGHLALWIDSRSGWWLCSAPLRVEKETTVSIHPPIHPPDQNLPSRPAKVRNGGACILNRKATLLRTHVHSLHTLISPTKLGPCRAEPSWTAGLRALWSSRTRRTHGVRPFRKREQIETTERVSAAPSLYSVRRHDGHQTLSSEARSARLRRRRQKIVRVRASLCTLPADANCIGGLGGYVIPLLALFTQRLSLVPGGK